MRAANGTFKRGREFHHVVNLDERGYYSASVVNTSSGQAVFEIRAGDSADEDCSSIFEDGYMKHGDDMDGLYDYLVELEILTLDDILINKH